MSRRKKYKNLSAKQMITSLIIFVIIILFTFISEKIDYNSSNVETNSNIFGKTTYSNLIDIPDYSGEICVMINDNKPYFTEEDYTTKAFENYSELDYLGRCGVAYANICKETMPAKGDKRGDISSVHPSRMETN